MIIQNRYMWLYVCMLYNKKTLLKNKHSYSYTTLHYPTLYLTIPLLLFFELLFIEILVELFLIYKN